MTTVASVLAQLAISADEIASRSRISPERVRAIIEGEPATLAELRALSHGLHIPMRTLATGDVATARNDDLGILFRNAFRATPGYQRTAEDVAQFVDAAISILPARDRTPTWLNAFSAETEEYGEAHRLAYLFRNGLIPDRMDDPLTDLPELLTRLDALVLSTLQYSRYEGASLVNRGYCFIFVSPRFVARMLFTLAHELGHLIAHHSTAEIAVFDRPSQIGSARGTSRRERFVDAFASILLLPDRAVGMALKKIRHMFDISSDEVGDIEILLLARFFGVSFTVAARRCEDLELLPPGGAASLNDRLKKDFGSPEARADALGLPPRPRVVIPKISDNLLLAILDKINSGEISAGWAANEFGFSIEEIYAAHAGLRGAHSH